MVFTNEKINPEFTNIWEKVTLYIMKAVRIFNYFRVIITLFASILILYILYIPKGYADDRIALLLPLQGQYAAAGQAIRDGFIAAYYQSLANDPQPPTIRIIDTSGGHIVDLYRQAIEQGASFIVGPLNKAEGSQLAQSAKASPLAVPTLLLNTLPEEVAVPNLYQLGLSPEDEAKQVAHKAWQNGHKNAIIIGPASTLGQRTFEEFANQWRTLGGRIVGQMYYDNPEQLAKQIAQLLHVDQSEQRGKELRSILQDSKIRTIAYRRQDFDMVFLVAKPELARELRPFLRFYYASKVPVYATSHIYSGFPEPKYDQDLNDIIFCAIPWEIDAYNLPVDVQAVLQNVQKIWPKASQQQSQFFALGVDSYRLARRLGDNSSVIPDSGIPGATGLLFLKPNKVWYRELPWAQMIDGQPRLLNK